MVKSSIKIVVLPLFIAILLTSFYVMQPQMVDAATKRYKNSGSQSDTPLASDRFDDVYKGYAPFFKLQQLNKNPSTISDSRIDFVLEQYVDCERDPTKGTCQDVFLSGTQIVNLQTPTSSPSNLDANFDLTEIQKDDTDDQDNVRNNLDADQIVTVTTAGNGKFDGSHNSNNNEVDLNIYQYNKRGTIDESLTDYEIDDIRAAIIDDDGGGNDDSKNEAEADQNYVVNARQGATVNVANKGSDQAFTIAQFNAGCDDHDLASGTEPDITCRNVAEQNVNLDAQGSATGTSTSNVLNFNTLGPIELQQVNTCKFSDDLNCLNDGSVDVNAITTGTGVANVELENPNGQPVLFQQNDCSDLVNSPSTQQCTNRSDNFFDVQKSGTASNIQKTNLDLQVAQANDCDDATAPIDCVNRGLTSTLTVNGRNIADFGPANTIATVYAQGAGSTIEDADPDSFLTMVNDCDGANPETSTLGSSNCVNEALNEAHFAASSGADVDVDRVVQQSTTINSCDNLDNDNCINTARNTFVANAANDATININSDVKQTNNLENDCDSAACLNDAINTMFLTADNGATLEASSSDLQQTHNLYNGCYDEADCDNIAQNTFIATAGNDPDGGDIIINDLTQETNLRNTCYGSGISCQLEATNLYMVTNNDDSPITISPEQSISLECSGNADCNQDATNQFIFTKTSGTSLTYTSSQLASSGGGSSSASINNSYSPPPNAQGSCQLNQNNGQTQVSGSPGSVC